jgi:hypothetical protein
MIMKKIGKGLQASAKARQQGKGGGLALPPAPASISKQKQEPNGIDQILKALQGLQNGGGGLGGIAGGDALSNILGALQNFRQKPERPLV